MRKAVGQEEGQEKTRENPNSPDSTTQGRWVGDGSGDNKRNWTERDVLEKGWQREGNLWVHL